MKELVIRKLELMSGYLSKLESFGCADLVPASAQSDTQFACERVYELLVEAAVDINQELCLEAGRDVPETYRKSFLILIELGILDEGEAEKLGATTRLRNRLVHDYEDTNITKVQAEIRGASVLFRTYMAAIKLHIGDYNA